MASLLDKSLDDISRQRKPSGRGGGRASNRPAPYKKPADSWTHDMHDADQERPARRRRADDAMDEGEDSGSRGRSNKLRIENLHYDVSERELEALFMQVGKIVEGPRIKFDKSGRSEGIAWVAYSNADLAQKAKDAFEGAPAKGQAINIFYDFSKPKGTLSAASLGEGAHLLARLGGVDVLRPRGGDRPERGRGRGIESRGRGRGRGSHRGGAPRVSEPKKSEADLDKELEDFMNA